MKKLVFFLFLCFSLPVFTNGQKTISGICGTITKPQLLPLPNSGLLLPQKTHFDRFGNSYAESELVINTALPTCSSGKFKLFFNGNFTDLEKNVICKTFLDISDEIELLPAFDNSISNILIGKTAYSENVHAAASPYYEDRYPLCKNIENNYVWRSLYVKNDTKRKDIYDGKIEFNILWGTSDAPKTYNWYTGNGTPLSNYVDLYTVTLHEALHLVGFASSILNNGEPNNSYTIWDKQLYSKALNQNVILPQNTIGCCGSHQKNTAIKFSTDVFKNCSDNTGAVIKQGIKEIKVYGAPVIGGLTNTISHLCDDKDPMYPSLGFGVARKNLSDDDKAILCAIGYKRKNCTTYDCMVQANDDTFFAPQGATSKVLKKSDIIINDFYTFASIQIEFENSKSVVLTGTDYTFTLQPGQNIFYYNLKSCDGLCSRAAVYINSLPQCTPTPNLCNLVCNGNFESSTQQSTQMLTNFRAHNYNKSIQNSIELYENNTDAVIFMTGNYVTSDFQSYFNFFCLNNNMTPYRFTGSANYSIPSIVPNSKFIHIGMNNYDTGGIGNDYFEAVLFELKDKLIPDKEYEISFAKFAGCAHSVNFAFSKELPCSQKSASIYPALFNGKIVPCTDINGGNVQFGTPQTINIPYPSDVILNSTATSYAANWSTVSGVKFKAEANAKYLIVFISPDNINTININGKSLFLDNITVTPVIPSPKVSSEIIEDCNKSQFSVQYEVCFPPNLSAPYNVDLKIDLPNGLAFNPNLGSFSLKPIVKVTVPTSTTAFCTTLTLVLDVVTNTLPLGTAVPIKLSLIPDTKTAVCFPNNIHITDYYASAPSISGNFSKTFLYQNFQKGYSGQIGTNIYVSSNLIMDVDYNFNGITLEVASGVSININENTTSQFVKCQFYTCGKEMWQGIEVFPTIKGKKGGEIVMTNSRIRDAHIAIKLNNTTLATITNNNFSYNYVDVYAENALAKFVAVNNRHSGTNTLKLPYKGQLLPIYIKKSYAAYSFTNASVSGAPLTIGASSSTITQELIDGFDLGIIAENTSLLTFGVSFANIQPSSISSGLGAAVYARSTNPDNMILVDGLGKSFTTFDNCLVGVYAQNVRLYVSNNTMVKVGTGVYGFNTPGGFIENNLIRCTTGGIGISDTRHQHILDNDIFCINPASHDSYGIWINKTVSIRDIETIVERNTIDMTNTTYGIRLSDAKNIQVLNNRDIFMQNARPNGFTDGINIINSTDCYIRGNNIVGGTPTNNTPNPLTKTETVGIFMQNSSSNTYCCNSMDRIYTGVEARNTNDITDNFLTTTFGNHHFGLWLRKRSFATNPTIGGQDFSGNTWNGTMAVGARNENSFLFQINKNPFLIETQVGLQPLSHPVIETPNAIGSKWFQTDNNGFSSICNNEPNGCFAQKPSGNIITDVDRLLLDDSSNGELSDLTRWQLTRNLYAKLEANPSLINKEEALVIFYEQTKNTAIANFVGIGEGIDYAKTYQTSAGNSIEKELIQKEKALISINEKVQSAEYDAALVKAQQDLYVEITTLFKALALEQVQAEKEKIEILYELQKRNASIKSELVYENNLQQVNKVILQQLLSPENTLDKEDILILENVAYQCDMEGGEAVQTARAMLSWLDINKYSFGRENECESGGVISKQQRNNNGEIKIYPNPTDGNMVFDCGRLSNTQLSIYDVNGKVVLSQNITDKLTPINISYLSNGIYYCRVLGEEKAIKFTIIH